MPEKTRKPCPGCGYDGTRAIKDFLCHSCQQYIAMGKIAEKAAEARGAALGDQGFIVIQIPKEPAASRLIPRPSEIQYNDPTVLAVGSAFVDLLQTLLPAVDDRPTVPYKRRSWENLRETPTRQGLFAHEFGRSPTLERLGREEFCKPIWALWGAIEAFGVFVYQKGLDRGRNLLTQLNAGEITLDQLNAENVRK